MACSAATLMAVAAAVEASPQPAVTTAATSVTGTSAALNGMIYPSGLDTNWEFQWGTTTSYGNNTVPPPTALDDAGPDQVMVRITGLQPGTTYHFRLIAIQGAAGASGESTGFAGADMTFTTPGAGSSPGGSTHSRSRASLHGRTLAVSHGVTQTLWQCTGTSGSICQGKISLSARGKIGGKMRTVSCGSGTFLAVTGHKHDVRAHLGSGCLTLIKNARNHRLHATLKASFSRGTGNLQAPVTLVG